MAFTPLSRDQLRTAILGYWAARYTAAGETLITAPGSDPYREADALAVVLEGQQAACATATLEVFPDTASDEGVAHHGDVQAVPRGQAVAARLTFEVTGGLGVLITLTGHSLVSTTGLAFTPDLPSIVGTGFAQTFTGTCTTAGTGGNLAAGTTVTWDSTPAGLAGATATVNGAPVVAGEDLEPVADWAQRIIATIQERPASGNRQDWADWVLACDGVSEVYVYPVMTPTTHTTAVPGCVTVVAVGPAQGDSTTNTRVLTAARCATIKGYIEGTHDAAGNVVSDGTQLRPVTMAAADYAVERQADQVVVVHLRLVLSGQYPWPWAGSHAIVSATATTITVAGDQSALATLPMLVPVASSARGRWQYTTPATATFGGVNTVLDDFNPPLVTTPVGTIYPAPPVWHAVRTALFSLFDHLGPGNAGTGTLSERYPSEDRQGRATLYVSQIAAAVMGVPGVLSVTVEDGLGSTLTDQTPTGLNTIALSELRMTKF